jgi:hypothetical protein
MTTAQAAPTAPHRATIAELTDPLLDIYGAELAKHGHTWRYDGTPGCLCGWNPTRPTTKRNAAGLHIAAAEKRASKDFDAACAAARAADEARYQLELAEFHRTAHLYR